MVRLQTLEDFANRSFEVLAGCLLSDTVENSLDISCLDASGFPQSLAQSRAQRRWTIRDLTRHLAPYRGFLYHGFFLLLWNSASSLTGQFLGSYVPNRGLTARLVQRWSWKVFATQEKKNENWSLETQNYLSRYALRVNRGIMIMLASENDLYVVCHFHLSSTPNDTYSINLWKKCHFWTIQEIKVWLKQGPQERGQGSCWIITINCCTGMMS